MGEQKSSILIVDDEKSNLDVLNHVLRSHYTVYVAKSGAAALKRAEADKPDLILLDVIMPDISGFDVIRQLKSDPGTRDIPVIFITGLTSIEDEEKGLSLGAVDFIAKPFHHPLVMARVRNHLRLVRQDRLIRNLCLLDPLTEIADADLLRQAKEAGGNRVRGGDVSAEQPGS